MNKIKKIITLSFISIFVLTSFGEAKLSKLEQQYVDKLHQWIKSGGSESTVRSVVQFNCSKLTMLMATKKERVSFVNKSFAKPPKSTPGCVEMTPTKSSPRYQNRNMLLTPCGNHNFQNSTEHALLLGRPRLHGLAKCNHCPKWESQF